MDRSWHNQQRTSKATTMVAGLPFAFAILCASLVSIASEGSRGANKILVHGWSVDIATWEPSTSLSQECPYYHAGYDFEGRPVMIAEFGKWDGRRYSEMDDKTFHEYEKYVEKFLWRVSLLHPIDPEAEDGVTLVLDMAGFDNRQVVTSKMISFILRIGHFTTLIEAHVAEIIMINASPAAVVFRTVFGSVSGRLVGKMDTYGPKKEIWMTKLLNTIPADQLPRWYGGKQSFKHVKFFG